MADCDVEETGPFRNNWCGLAAGRGGVEVFVGLTTSESREFHGYRGGGGGGGEGRRRAGPLILVSAPAACGEEEAN